MDSLKRFYITLLIIYGSNIFALEKISLQLDWLNQFQFAGYYMAKEKGYFKDEGLDVTIKEVTNTTNTIDDVLTLKSQYGVGKSSLVIDKLDGKKIILMAAIYQNSPMVLISLKKSNINSISKLKNKNIMLTQDARSAASIHSMLISQGLKLNDVKFQAHSFKLDDLINGKTDAMGCYLSNEPYILKKKNIKFTVYNPSDYGFNFYGGILFTSQKELNEHPIRVRKMYRAIIKGWNFAFNNINKTAKIIYEKYNSQNKSLDSLVYEGRILKKLAKFDEEKLGKIEIEKIEEIKRLYLLLGLNKSSSNFQLKNFIYDANKINLMKEEKEYLKQKRITFLTNINYPPFVINKGNDLSGIEIDYLKLISSKIKISPRFKIDNKNFSRTQKVIKNPNNIKYTQSLDEHNDKRLLVSDPILSMKIGLSTLTNKNYISNLSELKGKKIAMINHFPLFHKIKNEHQDIKFVIVKNIKEGFKLIKEKKIYGLIAKLPTLSYYIRNEDYSNIKITGILNYKYALKLTINKDNTLLYNILNKAISTITPKDKKQIYDKYFSLIYQNHPNYFWGYVIFISLIIIILIIVLINFRLKKEIKKRKIVEEELFSIANIDSLTNIYNRRKIESLYSAELIRVKRYKRDLSIIFFDIDNFKLINDQLGHSLGDEVLVSISNLVKNSIRKSDYFGRWGGEEFLIILPETTKDKATMIAHSLKDKINTYDFNIKRAVTCSFGVSQYEETDNADSLLTRTDNAMYYIKRNGKNSVKVV